MPIISRIGGGSSKVSVPIFTYTGTHTILDDGGGNWRIKFLTSGILNFSDISGSVDAFLVGGGGGGGTTADWNGGGGGGYTRTESGIILQNSTDYTVTIGSGGAANANGGQTSFLSYTANGGTKAGGTGDAGSGGSGSSGGGSGYRAGGSDGADGERAPSVTTGGIGQGSTTREFCDVDGALYAGGGGGAGSGSNNGGAGGGGNGGGTATSGIAIAGAVNTGGGGGGGYKSTHSAAGGSGIVIIRKHRG